MVFDFGENPKPFHELVEPDYPNVLGSSAEVRAKIDAHLPGIDWSDPTWGVLVGDGYSLEFSMREETEKRGFMIHVRGGGDPISSLLRFAVPNRWCLLDCSAGAWIDPKQPSQAGWEGFQAFRGRNLRPSS